MLAKPPSLPAVGRLLSYSSPSRLRKKKNKSSSPPRRTEGEGNSFASLRLCEKKIKYLAKTQSRKASGSQAYLRKAGRKVPKAFECLPRMAAENH